MSISLKSVAVSSGSTMLLRYLHFADALGKGIFLSGSIVYFTRITGLSVTEIGLGLSLAGIGGLAATVGLGPVADKIGPRLVLGLMLLLQAVGFLLYPAVDGAALFFVIAAVLGFADYGGGPSFGAIIGSMHPPETRVRERAILRTYFNIAFSLGSGVAALSIALGNQWLQFLPVVAAALMLVSAAFVPLLPRVPRVTKQNSRIFGAISDIKFMTVVALNFPLALNGTILLVALPLIVTNNTDLPDFVVPAILIINTVLVIAFQVPASRGADDVSGASRVGRESSYWLAGACAVIAFLHLLPTTLTAVGLAIAVLLLTVSELRQASAGWGLAHGLAPEHSRAEYIGTFNLHAVAQGVLGPALLVSAMGGLGELGWLFAAILILAAGMLLPAAVRSFTDSRHITAGNNE